jgi:fructokinase
MKSTYKVVGLGEVLWDMLPSGKQLGGAPTNFAYMATLLGNEGVVASRIGSDRLGQDTLRRIDALGLKAQFVQLDEAHPTGTARVSVDDQGQPRFTITEPAAWDFLEWTPAWQGLAQQADVVCFGTLAQRGTQSRDTVRRFLNAVNASTLRVCDVNLRQSYFSREVIEESFNLCEIVKLNHEELPIVAKLLGVEFGDIESCARHLLERFRLKLICVTRGADGSLLVSSSGASSHSGFKVKVADTVGAGDAFTASLTHYYLRGASLDAINEAAGRMAAWVASQPGGTPALQGRNLEDVLASL